jgi:hypothetical protein
MMQLCHQKLQFPYKNLVNLIIKLNLQLGSESLGHCHLESIDKGHHPQLPPDIAPTKPTDDHQEHKPDHCFLAQVY